MDKLYRLALKLAIFPIWFTFIMGAISYFSGDKLGGIYVTLLALLLVVLRLDKERRDEAQK